MKKNQLLLLMILLLQIVPVAIFAEVCIDGIFYELDASKKQAEVTIDNSFVQNSSDEARKTYKGVVTIPETVSYKGVTYDVTSIGTAAFWGNDELKDVKIPNSITHIGDNAFRSCPQLQSITIPKSVTNIGKAILEGCDAVSSIIVDKENKVYDSRDNCNAIIHTETNELIQGCPKTIIPNTVKRIGGYAFTGFTSLTSIDIPNSVTNIGEAAFMHTGLKEVVIPNSVVYIGIWSFDNCTNLSNITLSESLTSLPLWSFSSCNLSSITIPASVESIEDAFSASFTPITSVYFLSTNPPIIKDNMGLDSNTTIHVPVGYKDVYENNDLWKNFTIIDDVAIQTTAIATLSTSNVQHPSPIFDISGKLLSAPRKGINIINGKKVNTK